MLKRYAWPILYSLLLTAFTIWLALDTFVITRVYCDAAPSVQTEQPAAVRPTTEPAVLTGDSYRDDNISITLTEHREHDTTIYVADVTLASPSLLKTVLAGDSFGRNISEKTSEMAERSNAILAINGDYYGSRERGYVVRNGVLYRSSVNPGAEALAIMADGSFRIAGEDTISAQALAADGAVHVFSFGPALLIDGEITVTTRDEVGKAMADNPRTAIGIYEPGHYVLLVSDGRTAQSEGLTLYELAGFMQRLGVSTAYNLDGGGSSTMVFMGEVINNPTTNGRRITERSVSDIVCIGY